MLRGNHECWTGGTEAVETEKHLRGIDRRTFLRVVSMAGAAGLVYPGRLVSSLGSPDLSRVVFVMDDNATSGTSIDEAVVQNMMDCGIMNLTGLFAAGEAWKSLFPGIDPSSVIAIKINCRCSTMPTHVPVTNAVTNGLTQMIVDGSPFPENNIIVYDRDNDALSFSGYTLNTSGTGVRCFGTDEPGVGYSSESYDVHGVSQHLSKIVTEMADYLVNISVLKNHGPIAGVTLCLKSHLGTCDRPRDLHPNCADPYIPALDSLSQIREKQCINICDALFGVYSGGPGGSPQFAPNTVIMSRDIVAVDYWGREILADNGCTTTGDATHIDTAAGSPYNLGTNDPAQMDIINIENPAGVDGPPQPSGLMLEQNRPNPFGGQTQIRFYVPTTDEARLTVYDATGRHVRTLIDGRIPRGSHQVNWDGSNGTGRRVAPGLYFCRLVSNGFQRAITMQVAR
jgi:uncharacterized protein (DUF362 family)